jgi:predicted dehydrogenase
MSEMERREFLAHAAGALAVLSLMPEFVPAAPSGLEPLPIGLVGAGRQGGAILDQLQKLEAAKVVAVCDTEQPRIERGLRRAAGAEGFNDFAQMLDKRKDLKAVIIATPTHQHKELAVAALGAGLHVYCECPLAHTVEDCRAIAGAARGARSVFAAGLEGRSNPVYKLARSFFKTEAVSELASVHAQHHQKHSWRAAAADAARDKVLNWRLDKDVSLGLAGELGTHQFDVVHWFRNQLPTEVRGNGAVRLYDDGRDVADTVSCDLAFKDGVHLQYSATLCNSFEGRHEVFHGANAALKLAWSHGWMFKESDSPTMGFEVYANRQQFHNDEGITLIADATQLASQGKLKEGVGLPHPSAYYAVSDFLKACAQGGTPPVTAQDALVATAVGIAAHKAVLSKTAVEITADMLTA